MICKWLALKCNPRNKKERKNPSNLVIWGVLDFLKQDSLSISIQPLDCGFLTKDIKLYIEIYGGNPFIENDRSFYKMVLTDLVYNNTIEKDIYYLHIEPDLDLRRYGSVPHAGFGMGLERVVAWICGISHIRETVPFARTMTRLNPW